MTPDFATARDVPFYAVIFTSKRTSQGADYTKMAEYMLVLARQQDGYLGIESARNEDGFGISVSYWTTLDAIAQWKKNAEHQIAQDYGKTNWYEHYEVKIARVEKTYGKL